MNKWSPTSWLQYPYLQAARYTDEAQLNKVVAQLSKLPPLVNPDEIRTLRKEIASAGRGEAFILQGGDCAESFNDCHPEIISNKLKIMLQMSEILVHGLRKPIIRIGRIAGQYAKPRSSDYETLNGITLPSYRGDLVNLPEFTKEAREPNPELLAQAYHCSARTLHYIRSLLESDFTDLCHTKHWDLSFVEHLKEKEGYQKLLESINGALNIEAIKSQKLSKVNFYTSHEALHLHYEQALTRQSKEGLWYNLSTHLPWIGMRTGQTDSAHLEILRGVQNPIGIKIGPEATPEWLEELINKANPCHEEGRLLLYTRLGSKDTGKLLPPLIKAAKKTKIPVTWSCDPMHGNTEITSEGIKTRHFDTVLSELKQTIEIHRDMGSFLGGVHFELTGDNVTECLGGARDLTPEDLKKAYHSLVDPRLNYEQSIEMAFQLSTR